MSEIKLLVEQNVGKIIFNYDETKSFLQEKMAEYDGAVFTDETMDIAKKERAALRKLKTQMDNERKNVKSAWMKPYTEFETQVKELLNLVDKPVAAIDEQVKEYEEKKKQEKLETCKKIYGEEIGDFTDVLPFEKIYDSKWVNASTTLKSIREEISGVVERTRTQIETIKMMNSDAVEKALEIYRDTLDMARAVAYINQYEATKREVEEKERKRREAEEQRKIEAERERIRQEERARIRQEEEMKQAAKQEAVEELKKVSREVKESNVILPESKTVLYAITGTEEELKELEVTMTSLGICFERK